MGGIVSDGSEGVKEKTAGKEETFGRGTWYGCGTVRRPCHNTRGGGGHGQETVPQRAAIHSFPGSCLGTHDPRGSASQPRLCRDAYHHRVTTSIKPVCPASLRALE